MSHHPPFLLYVVDDDEDDLYIINNAFRQIGLDGVCKGFLTGKELLSHIKYNLEKELPNVIVLDYEMPKMNGKQLLITLRNIPELEDVPIVIYSDRINSELEAELKALGAYCCIRKGISVNEQKNFAETIHQYLKK